MVQTRDNQRVSIFFTFVAILIFCGSTIASTTDLISSTGLLSPNEDTTNNKNKNVLPPSKVNEPLTSCPTNTTPFTTCGIERYCAPDPTLSSDLNTDDSTNTSLLCLHKTLFPVSSRDVTVILLVSICCFVAAMAGIGGGGLLLPLVMIGLNFLPKQAAVIGNAGVFGNTFCQLLVNSWPSSETTSKVVGNNPHPSYEVAGTVLMILPGLLAGGSVAITLEGAVPATVILIFAVVTLVLACVKTVLKAASMRRKEKEIEVLEWARGSSISQKWVSGTASSAPPVPDDHFDAPQKSYWNDISVVGGTSGLLSDVNRLCSKYGIELLIFVCWFTNDILFFIMFRGQKIGISKCSTAYFVLVFTPVFVAVVFIVLGRKEIHRHSRPHKVDLRPEERRLLPVTCSSQPSPSDTPFDNLVWWLPPISLLIGLLSALLGIGGGELLGPTLLLLNMDPTVSSATTAVLSLMNSGTNALRHAVSGMYVSYAYAAVLWCAGFVGGGGGRVLALCLRRKSVIAFSLGGVLGVAAGLMAYELAVSEVDWSSQGVC